MRRGAAAVALVAGLLVAGVAAIPATAHAQTCTFDTWRIDPDGHQQRTIQTGGYCSEVGARHSWQDYWGNQGGWTQWNFDIDGSVLSDYKEYYVTGEGMGQTG